MPFFLLKPSPWGSQQGCHLWECQRQRIPPVFLFLSQHAFTAAVTGLRNPHLLPVTPPRKICFPIKALLRWPQILPTPTPTQNESPSVGIHGVQVPSTPTLAGPHGMAR